MQTEKIKAAKEWATHLHDNTKILYRGESYADAHLDIVVNTAIEFISLIPEPLREDIICACWCHDTLEDCPVSYNDLVEIIGIFAADVVYDVTDELGKNRKQRQLKTYSKIADNPYAVFIKLCDRIVNTSDPGSKREMYQKEFKGFRDALYKKGQWEPLWNKLESITYEKDL